VERGIIKVGEEIEIVGIRDTQTTTVTGVEMFRKLLDRGQAGDNVGLLLRGTKREEVERGQVLAKPGSITPHTRFKAELYVLGKDESGISATVYNGVMSQLNFRTSDVFGIIRPDDDAEAFLRKDDILATIALNTPTAMEPGSRFVVKEGNVTIGIGVVVDIIE
jgi:elongation factor Tu